MAQAAEATTTTPAVAVYQPQAEGPTASTMQESTATETTSSDAAKPAEKERLIFRGSERNLVPGMGMLFAAVLAFSMGMTDVFFAEATAWTFAIWGALLIYMGLLDATQSYEVTDDALIILNPARPWGARKEWHWGNIRRMDIVVKRPDERTKDVMLQVYFQEEGEAAIEREDRTYDPELARLIIERAGLRPADRGNPTDLTKLPAGKATYTWN
jgi:hypothetical protein